MNTCDPLWINKSCTTHQSSHFNPPMGVLFRYEDSEDDLVQPPVRRAGGWRYDETSEPSGSESGSNSEERTTLWYDWAQHFEFDFNHRMFFGSTCYTILVISIFKKKSNIQGRSQGMSQVQAHLDQDLQQWIYSCQPSNHVTHWGLKGTVHHMQAMVQTLNASRRFSRTLPANANVGSQQGVDQNMSDFLVITEGVTGRCALEFAVCNRSQDLEDRRLGFEIRGLLWWCFSTIDHCYLFTINHDQWVWVSSHNNWYHHGHISSWSTGLIQPTGLLNLEEQPGHRVEAIAFAEQPGCVFLELARKGSPEQRGGFEGLMIVPSTKVTCLTVDSICSFDYFVVHFFYNIICLFGWNIPRLRIMWSFVAEAIQGGTAHPANQTASVHAFFGHMWWTAGESMPTKLLD